MAPLKRWIALTLAGCVAIVLASVPPRGATARGGPRFFATQLPQRTPARERAQALADEWRHTDAARRLLEDRQRVRQLVRDRARDAPGRPFVIVRGTAAPVAQHYVESVLDTIWRNLGLGETKVRVAVVIELAAARGSIDRPSSDQDGPSYLAPDSTDRTTCVVFLPAGPYWTRIMTGSQRAVPVRFAQWLQAGLGPCAFYASYGTPGKPVRRWLAARGWDVGLLFALKPPPSDRFSGMTWMGDPRRPWFWEAVYTFPPATVACLAGRTSGCRAAVLTGATDVGSVPFPEVVRFERRWWRAQHLVPGERFLADVAREVGRDRFQRFWTSPLPVDTALAAALKKPVGEWTEQWERRFVPRIRLGAAAPLSATVLALLLAAAAVAAVALTASRRQVR